MTAQYITTNRTIHQNLNAGVDVQPYERLDAKMEALEKMRECAKPPISVIAKDTEYPSKLHAEDVLRAMERGILKQALRPYERRCPLSPLQDQRLFLQFSIWS